MRRPPVDAILVTFNRPEALAESCRAALAQTAPPRNLVVVDNSPSPVAEPVVDELRSEAGPGSTRIHVLHPGDNLGPPGAHDAGFRFLTERIGDLGWVLLLDDDDPLPSSSVVERLLGAVPEHGADRVGGIALMGMRFVRPGLLLGGPVDTMRAELVPADGLLGWAAPLYRASAVAEVGGFQPELFWGLDDIELGIRLRRAGWSLCVAAEVMRSLPTMSAKMPGEPRTGLVPPAPRDYYTLRNRVYIGRRYFPARTVVTAIAIRALLKPILNFPLHPVLASRILRLNLRAIAAGLRGRMGRTVELRGETRADRGRVDV